MNTFEVIAARRSAKRLEEPAPNRAQLTQMFEAASLAPDHKELKPWQFIVLQGEKKAKFSDVLVEGLLVREPTASEGQIEKARTAPTRAPLIVVAVARRMPNSLPFEEMYAATCAAVQNLLLAATELGFGSIWRSGTAIHDDHVRDWLEIPYGDEIVGFIYLGTTTSEPKPRPPVDLADTVLW